MFLMIIFSCNFIRFIDYRHYLNKTKKIQAIFQIIYAIIVIIGFPGGSVVKNLPTSFTDRSSISVGDAGLIPGWEHPLEKEMATHFGILAWRISWTENTGGLQTMGSQKSLT